MCLAMVLPGCPAPPHPRSLDRCVNLVAANHRTATMSGSGAFSCGQVKAAVYSPGREGGGVVHVVTLPKTPSRTHTHNATTTAGTIKVATHHPRKLAVPPAEAAVLPLPLPLHGVANTSGLRSGKGWAFAPMASGKVCSGTVCCTATDVMGVGSGYAIAALQGDDDGGGITWYGEACAVLPCAAPGPRCLDYQAPPPSGLTKVALRMEIGSGASNRSAGTSVYSSGLGLLPMALAVSADGAQQHLLQPGPALSFDAAALALTASTAGAGAAPRSTLSSVVVYRRVFDKDTLAYSCPLATTTQPAVPVGVARANLRVEGK